MVEYKASIQELLDKTISKMSQESRQDDARYHEFARVQRHHGQQLQSVKGFQSNLDTLMHDIGQNTHTTNFMSTTLPVLIHLAVCQGLDQVLGNEYKSKLLAFEKSKINELDSYIKTSAHSSCIRLMHERLLTFMKFMKRHDQGCVPFTFGVDVYQDMPREELSFMHQT